MPADKSFWRTPAFRHNVIVKIDDTIQKSSGIMTIKKSVDMENFYFQRAKTKAEYVDSVSRYIMRVKKTIKKNTGLDIASRIKEISTEEVSWRSPPFRESVIIKVNEAIQLSGTTLERNGVQMEHDFFQKARTKEEYLDSLKQFILSLREITTKNTGVDMATKIAIDLDTWRTPAFRKSVVNKINETLKRSRLLQKKTTFEVENKLFEKANTEEEYLNFVAKVILHIRDTNPTTTDYHTATETSEILDLIGAQQTPLCQDTGNNEMIVANRTCPRPQGLAQHPPLKKQRITNERGENQS